MNDILKIVEGCKSGDRKSQASLYELYSKKMYGVCMRYMKDQDDACDILHEGFIKIFKNIQQLKEPKAIEGWMRKIIVNTALEKFRNTIQTEPIHEIYVKTKEDDTNIESEISKQDLLKLVQNLSPQYRTVFNLYAIEGYSHKEISKMLNISEGTSKSNLSRARTILQEKVSALYNSSTLITKKHE